MNRKLLLFIALQLSIAFCFSQEHTHRLYTIYDGLPQSQVQCVAQDKEGYILVGTKGGAARFDGFEFKTYTVDDGLISNFINVIHPTDSCIYFIATNGISVFNEEKFNNFQNEFIGESKFSGSINEKILLRCKNLEIVEFKNGKFNRTFIDTITKKDDVCIRCKYWDNEDAYTYHLLHKGSFYYKDGIEKRLYDSHLNLSSLFNDSIFLYSLANPITDFEEVYSLNINTLERCLLHTINNRISPSYFYKRINDVVFAIGMSDVVIIKKDLTILKINKVFNKANDVLIDKDNNIWIADEDGLYCFYNLAFIDYNKVNAGLPDYVWDISEFPKGEYWFATYNKGLYKYDGCRFEGLQIPEFEGSLSRYYYFNTPKVTNSVILNNSLYPIINNGENFKLLLPNVEKVNAPFCTFLDTINARVIVTANRPKLVVQNKNNKVKSFSAEELSISRNILDVEYDRYNDLCMGEKGLFKFIDDSLVPYPNMPDSVPFRVFTLKKDHKGNLWAGTDNGLWFYNYDTIFQVAPEYFKSYITFLELVDSTWLMGGAIEGLPLLNLELFYKKGKQKVKYYDRYNGFSGRECGQNGTLHDSKNTFWIPTVDRVMRLDPTKISWNTSPPVLHMNSVSILGDNLSWNKASNGKSTFAYNENGLRFSFVGLNFSAPERVQYKYRLIGMNDTWSKPIKERFAIFTNLDPGKYTFELMACNEDEYWTEQSMQYHFNIIPAWWQTLWFRLAYTIIPLLSVAYLSFYLTRKRNLKRQKEQANHNRMLQMKLSSIKNQMDPHFTLNALNNIESLILKEDRELAYDFLLKWSDLIRASLQNTEDSKHTLYSELKFVETYLKLEKLRFKDKFYYKLLIPDSIQQNIEVPWHIIQTFVENSIKHGLMHLEEEGLLTVEIFTNDLGYNVVIEDNGVGREQSAYYNQHSTGLGLNLIRKYINNFNEQHKTDINFKIVDLFNLDNTPRGTRVEVSIPLM